MTADEPERGYFIAAMNARQAPAGTLSVSPSRFLMSRTITAPGALATSTHSPQRPTGSLGTVARYERPNDPAGLQHRM